jgi:hypothetical protein
VAEVEREVADRVKRRHQVARDRLEFLDQRICAPRERLQRRHGQPALGQELGEVVDDGGERVVVGGGRREGRLAAGDPSLAIVGLSCSRNPGSFAHVCWKATR